MSRVLAYFSPCLFRLHLLSRPPRFPCFFCCGLSRTLFIPPPNSLHPSSELPFSPLYLTACVSLHLYLFLSPFATLSSKFSIGHSYSVHDSCFILIKKCVLFPMEVNLDETFVIFRVSSSFPQSNKTKKKETKFDFHQSKIVQFIWHNSSNKRAKERETNVIHKK